MEPDEEVRLLDRAITRRRFLVMGGATIGALTLGGTGLLAACSGEDQTTTTTPTTPTTDGGATTTTTTVPTDQSFVQPLMTLSATQAAILGAAVSRLIPADDLGPSAAEAGVVGYIDRALLEDADRGASFLINLDALDSFAKESQGSDFAGLSAEKQDAVLSAVQGGQAPGFVPNSGLFFFSLRQRTLEGMFGDPYYGGNRGFVGWELIGFPGIYLDVSEADQALDAEPALLKKSVYDYNEHGYTVQGG